MSAHVSGRTNGTGYPNFMALLDGFCELNEDYQGTDLNLYLHGGSFTFHHEDLVHDHNTVDTAFNRLVALETPNTLNTWIVSSAAGFCGYDLMCTGVAVSHSCLLGHTWSHEAGHYFSLKHPFHGWYGNSHNYALPAPDTFLFNWPFQYLCGGDFTLTDTVETELANGSNCAYAGDGICDTQADYLWSRWNCDANNMSNQTLIDPTGVTFRANGSTIMSYANDNCQHNFTNQQVNLMHNYIQDEKPSLMQPNPGYVPITAIATPLSPAAGAIVQSGMVDLSWASSPGSTHYVVQVFTGSGTSNMRMQMIVTDTFTTVSLPAAPVPFSWHVRPFNGMYACTQTSPLQSFRTANLASSTEANGGFVELYPNPAGSESGFVTLAMTGVGNGMAAIQVFNIEGKAVLDEQFQFNGQELLIPINRLTSGVYMLRVQILGNSFVRKLVIQ